MDSPEADLLNRAKNGEAGAFEALVRPHVPSLRRFVFSFARRWQDADDLAQEALIKAFRSLDSFEGRASFSTWLYVVTRGICRDWYRGRLAKAREREAELEDGPDDALDAQDELLERREASARLWVAIRRLEPDFRTPLVLFDIEGLTYEEIAEVLGMRIGTVRSRIARGRDALRRLLGPGEETSP